MKTPAVLRGRVPEDVRELLREKCSDCHSDQPRVPIYGRLAPFSWLVERDIVRARTAMNLSEWDHYSEAQRQILAAKMVQEMKSGAMPPFQYRMFHWKARIASEEISSVGKWVHDSQRIQGDASDAAEGGPEQGRKLFEKRCTGCHALTENHEGPQLQGVYGRTSGATSNFSYSHALKSARIVWDDQSLDKWLTEPDAFIPGNDMDFLVSNPQERRDLISYLKQISGR